MLTRAAAPRRQTASIFSRTIRSLTSKPPGTNPLEVMRHMAEQRLLCDHSGVRRAGQHWSFQLAMNKINKNSIPAAAAAAPSLRTVNFQRVTPNGIEFVTKSTSSSAYDNPVSMVYTSGQYKPGEKVEQWRGEGRCIPANVEELLPIVPHYTLVGMLASRRVQKQHMEEEDAATNQSDVNDDRTRVKNHSQYIELLQKTRVALENGNVSQEELLDCITAFRFVPYRLELMAASPDLVSLDRWEWEREDQEDADGEFGPWGTAKHLMPF